MKRVPSMCYCGERFVSKTLLTSHKRTCFAAAEVARSNKRKECFKNLQKAEEAKRNDPDGWRRSILLGLRAHEYTAEERAKRSKTMRMVNASYKDQFHTVRSENAKRTALRPDIIKRRAEVLALWRKSHPEEFKKITLKAQSAVKKSMAEEWLSKHVLTTGYERSSQVRCGDRLKQVDFVCPEKGIWIEVDGCWHFGMTFTKKTRFDENKVHERDMMLCKEAQKRGLMLIRLGLECWRGHGKRMLKDEWKTALDTLLRNPIPGVWFFGKSYLQGLWEKDICTTWRYVTDPITLRSQTV